MSESQHKIITWAQETFGPADPSAVFRKFHDEVGELTRAFDSGDKRAIRKKCGDVLVMLFRLTDHADGDLVAILEDVMAENRAREWNLNSDGTAQHVGAEAVR